MKIKTPIYLDNNSTTPVDPRVLEAMLPYYQNIFGNPSSNHSFGWQAKSAIEYSREQVANLLEADADEIIFTGGATESINIAHFGIAESLSSRGNHIITTETEHSASFDSLQELAKKGFEITVLKVNKQGSIDPDDLRKNINDRTILVSVIYGNNEIGTLNNVEEIGNICKDAGVIFHTDATQIIGKLNFNPEAFGVDLASFTAHKIYGPKGTGGLFISKSIKKIIPRFFGGGQEKDLRPGTYNVAGIVGLGKACEICKNEMTEDLEHTKGLKNKLFTSLLSNLDEVYLNGSKENRLPNNLNLIIKNVSADKLMLELRDIAFSKSSACASGSGKPSRILKAIGLSDEDSRCSVRFGIGRFNTEEEIDYSANRIIEAVNKLRALLKNKIYQNQE